MLPMPQKRNLQADNRKEQQMTKSEVMNKQIDEIMDWFDFDKVHKVMTLLNWEWSKTNGVPAVGDMRAAVRGHLKEAAKQGFCSTGGFSALRIDGNEDGKDWVKMKLSFEVASWDMDGEDYNKGE